MAKYKLTVVATTETPDKAQTLGNLLQGALDKVATDDIAKLLKKVNDNPGIVKTALKFI